MGGRNPPARNEELVEWVWVWPEHAAQIAFWLLIIGILVVFAWHDLRGKSCWKCGRERGLCQHTRYDDVAP
jgi:hypothetical protein